jgi:hypothetical protein
MNKLTSLVLIVLLTASTAAAAELGRKDPARHTLQREARANPKVPVIVDGSWYAPDEMIRFQGQDLIYFVDQEAIDGGFVWAFTTAAGAEEHLARGAAERETQLKICSTARFNKVAYGTGIDWMTMVCGQTSGFIGSSWNDRISYVEAGGSYTVLYSNSYFGGDKLPVTGGNTIPDLNAYGFNNRTTSIKVCPEGYSLTACLSY